MKIAFTTSALDKTFGGPPNAIVGAATALSSRGHDVTVIIFGQSEESESQNLELFTALQINNVRIIRLRSLGTRVRGGLPNLSDLRKILNVIASCDFVSVHGIYYYQNPLIAYVCNWKGAPYSVMPHGSLTHYQRGQKRFKKRFFGAIFDSYVPRGANSIFVATKAELEQLPSRLKSKGVVVGLGIHSGLLRNKVPKKSEDVFTFLYLGRITKKKRLDLLVSSIAILKSFNVPLFRLVICGSGDETIKKSLQDMARELNVDELIEYRGWVSGNQKSIVLSSAHCFVLTSHDENFGIAIPESLSYGLPCILSSRVATSNVVADFNAGVVIDLLEPIEIAQAMLRIINSDDLDNMSRSAVEASKVFYWDKVIIEWEAAITNIKKDIN